jgi:TetR/AcrR family transcriptional repressor of nem operon
MEAVGELFWTGSYDSTTIDQICEKAGVKKGSFYYFFEGKAALAEAALEFEWETYRPKLDAIFSASVPPLERIQRHCEFTLEQQADLKAEHGCVLGCPLCTLGTEICTQDKGLQKKVQAIMAQGLKYLETAIRDAHAAGVIHAPDPHAKANVLHAYLLGLLTQARIKNDLGVLANLTSTTFDLLGVKQPKPQAKTRRAEVAV